MNDKTTAYEKGPDKNRLGYAEPNIMQLIPSSAAQQRFGNMHEKGSSLTGRLKPNLFLSRGQ